MRFFLALALIAFTACHSSNKQLKEIINNSDSVAINYFRGDGSMDTVVSVKIIRDKNSIQQLVNYVTASSADAKPSCGFDGSLHFFKQNQVIQNIDFRMNDNQCMFFTFSTEGKPCATALSADAKKLLQSTREH